MDPRLIAYFSTYVTDNRKDLIEQILTKRTRAITVVLEDIYQSQNASAVVRSCDCFGIQDLHVIENSNTFTLNPNVVHGASKWVDLHRYDQAENNTAECIKLLRGKGYKILATTPDPTAVPIYDYSLDEPTAVLFGTEKTGLSETAFQLADATVTIPMFGFTESLNLSVSASLVLSILRDKLAENSLDWQLSSGERDEIRLKWYKLSVSRADILEREFMKSLKE